MIVHYLRNNFSKIIALSSIVGIAFFAYKFFPDLLRTKSSEIEISVETFPVFVRTNGGMLEVGKVRYRKNLKLEKHLTILGKEVPFCPEKASVSIDTHFTYRVRLAKVWPAEYRKGRLAVVAPALEPALPVAFDTTRMSEQLSSCWFMMDMETRQDLLRSISERLEKAAKSPAQIKFARNNGAKETVAEFVRTWLIAQKGYDLPRNTPVDVSFADE